MQPQPLPFQRMSLVKRIEWARRVKEEAVEELSSTVGGEGVERARRDHHSRRKPRPCGLTIHTGYGCSYGCIYCYIYDMGFPASPEPYPLTVEEQALAIALNPYVVPGHTFAAYGSVTEPFLHEVLDRSVRLISTVYRYLRLPSQVSTKSLLIGAVVEGLMRGDPNLSVLVSVSAVGREARILEPRAPPAEDRILYAGWAARRGLRVALFMRPIIPGVTDRQASTILRMAWEAGVREVVLGSLRVTTRILMVLEHAGFPVPAQLIPRVPRSRREQVTLRASTLKEAIAAEARRMGFKVYPTACAANTVSHSLPCNMCRYGPCYTQPPTPSPEEVEEALEILGLKRYKLVRVTGYEILLKGPRPTKRVEPSLYWLRDTSRLRVRIAGKMTI